jgi:hypothetical protein
MRGALIIVPAFTSLVVAACGTEPRGCDICTTSAVVYGAVQSATGAPVPSARIAIEARAPDCHGSDDNYFGDPVTSDADGNYRMRVRSLVSPMTVCLIVNVQPPPSTTLTITADTGRVVQLRPDYTAGQALDSVRVDLVLRARP